MYPSGSTLNLLIYTKKMCLMLGEILNIIWHPAPMKDSTV